MQDSCIAMHEKSFLANNLVYLARNLATCTIF